MSYCCHFGQSLVMQGAHWKVEIPSTVLDGLNGESEVGGNLGDGLTYEDWRGSAKKGWFDAL